MCQNSCVASSIAPCSLAWSRWRPHPQLHHPTPPQGNPFPASDAHTGVTQRRLSNGVRLNYRHTANEPRAAWLRLVAAGGRVLERSEVGADGPGVVTVGTRTLSESGTVGHWDRQQVELFCISKLINCVLESDEEFIIMDFHFAVGAWADPGGGWCAIALCCAASSTCLAPPSTLQKRIPTVVHLSDTTPGICASQRSTITLPTHRTPPHNIPHTRTTS